MGRSERALDAPGSLPLRACDPYDGRLIRADDETG